MLARVIEAWTDSVTERAYQPAFLQMLVAQGHRILHNTRHSSLEFGKDVITRDRRGTLCAYQLKGHPGRRLRKSDVAEMIPQLNELLNLHVQHPNVKPGTRHKAFLVTNGQIEEEAWVSLRALRDGLKNSSAASSFEIISRGDFLAWALELEGDLWPQGVDDWRRLLDILAVKGTHPFPVDLLAPLLRGILGKKCTRTDIRRKVASAAIFTALATRGFSAEENHLAEATAWVVFSTSVLGAVSKNRLKSKTVDDILDIAEDAIRTAVVKLIVEASGRPSPAGADLGEPISYHYRLPILCGMAGLLRFWLPPADGDVHSRVKTFLATHFSRLSVWGEAAVPSILMASWAVGLTGDQHLAEHKLNRILREILSRALGTGPPIYGPYWQAEPVMIHFHANFLLPNDDPLYDESGRGESYYSEAILQVLARHNQKSLCVAAWPDFSKVTVSQFNPSSDADYCAWHTDAGINETKVPQPRKKWESLLDEAYAQATGDVPTVLAARPFLTAMFCMLVPQRCTTATVRWLAAQFDSSWRDGVGRLVPGSVST